MNTDTLPSAPSTADRTGPGPGRSDEAGHVRALFVQSPASLTGNLIGVALVGTIFWPLAERGLMTAWLGAAAVLWSLRLGDRKSNV